MPRLSTEKSVPLGHEDVAGEGKPRDRLRLVLRSEASLEDDGAGGLEAGWGWGRLTMRSLPPEVHRALVRLGEGASRHEMAAEVLAADGGRSLWRLYYHLTELEARGLLEHIAFLGPRPLAVFRPLGEAGWRRPCPEHDPVNRRRRYVLSSFALLHRKERRVVVESPLGMGTVILEDPLSIAAVTRLLDAADLGDVLAGLPSPPGVSHDELTGAAEEILQLLSDARVLTFLTEDGTLREDADPDLGLWAFHDLYFHNRSRFGRHDGPFGGRFRHVGRLSPPPAVKPASGGQRIKLARPDLAAIHAQEPSLGEVMEERSSVKTYSTQPLRLEQLATFLYRVGRIKATDSFEVSSPDGKDHATYEVTSRPYPAGGRAHETELYLAIGSCEGIDPGLYRYDPLLHELEEVRPFDPSVEALLAYTCTAAGIAKPPPVLIVLTARFARVSWKYDAIAYATILKHVGVLYELMYLVATSMRLAPCALGSGSSDLFAEAAGLDALVEASVGEFMLGPRVGESDRTAADQPAEVT